MAPYDGDEDRFQNSPSRTTRVADEDDALFQVAISESLDSAATQSDSGQATPSEQPDVPNDPPVLPRVTIDDMIGKLASRNTAELPGFDDPQGDTWIFIDAAPQQPEQDELDYEHYVKRCSAPFRLKKETLMKLHSPIIDNTFGPTAQFRLLRRRKLVDKLPEGIKYIVDLTPPSEGEDAVWLISSLSCSEGVRHWHFSQKIWAVPPHLVGGEEEYTSRRSTQSERRRTNFASPRSDPIQIPTKESKVANPSNSGSQTPSPPAKRGIQRPSRCPEYSPIRHRAAIERLLATVAGADPKLDSAPKLWTTFAVAKHLGVVRSPLTDYIVTWLRSYPNSIFLEVLPEASHIMADQLEVYDLERDTFAMLVGEEALDSIVRSRIPRGPGSLSTFGRTKEDLPEHIQTRVEYASKNFTERITADFEELKRVGWIESLPEYEKLSSYTQPELQSFVSLLKTRLKDWVRGTIMHVQCSQYEAVPDAKIQSCGGEDLVPRWNRKDIFHSLRPEERILTRTFWTSLESLCLFDGSSNLDIQPEWEESVILAKSFGEPTLAEDGYHRVKKSSLYSTINAGQHQLDTLELRTCQTTETDCVDALSTSKPKGSSAYVPTEVAENFPLLENLPMRPKFEQNFLSARHAYEPEPRDHIFNDDGDKNCPASLISYGNLHRSPSETLTEGTAREKAPKISEIYKILNPTSGVVTNILNRSSGELMEDASADSEIEEQNAIADWAESLYGKESPVIDNAFDASDTSPLLNKTNELLSNRDNPFWKGHVDEKHGTKRPAESYQSEPFANATFTNKASPLSPKKPRLPNLPKIINFFNLNRFFSQADEHIRMVARLKLSYTDVINGRKEPYELRLINTLVCLDEPEFKFLPLWAGGCDDDTGGVFSDDVAMPDVSFATAGPSIQHGAGMHTVSECDTVSMDGTPRGIATPTSSVPSSEYHLVKDAASTVAPSSNHTTAGYFSDKLDSDLVYAADSADDVSVSSDDFSIVARSEGLSPDDEEENARREIEAMERIEAAEAEAARAAKQERITPEDDENYADLFGSEDGDDEIDDGNASDDTMRDDDNDNDDCGSGGELI